MPVKVDVFLVRGNGRSRKLSEPLQTGALRAGYSAKVLSNIGYVEPHGDIAAFYAYESNMPVIMNDYIESGRKVVFLDLGYWGRSRIRRGQYASPSYHKVAINSRHPGDYLMETDKPDTRFRSFGLDVKPWRQKGDHILLAGMSGRASRSIGKKPEEWERWAVNEIKKHTDRMIIYRSKPTCKEARLIPGTRFGGGRHLGPLLNNCHAVVTHHSNVAVDGLIEGVPAFCMEGVATHMSRQDLSQIENPIRPDGRNQWLANVAWCQWNVEEIRNGTMWRHLREDGLIP